MSSEEDDLEAKSTKDIVGRVLVQVLLFCLIFGLAGTVAAKDVLRAFKDRRGIATGAICQFVLLPFTGFLACTVFDLPPVTGVTLLVLTSSPGGSYSNWWCSLVNADLALSVAMTAVSSVLAVGLLPINLAMYVEAHYGATDVSINWAAMGLALCVVMLGISAGLVASALYPQHRRRFNKFGNAAGILLILSGIVFSSSSNDPIWDRELKWYLAIIIPCCTGLLVSLGISSVFRLPKPQRISVAIETCYQNTGVALAVALATFSGDEASAAAGVPVFYSVCQIIALGTMSVWAWKAGWTYAPSSTPFLKALLANWQPSLEDGFAHVTGLCQVLPGDGNTDGEPRQLGEETTPERKTREPDPPFHSLSTLGV